MKEHSQIRKIISVLMIFLLLMQLSGCYVTKIIPSSALPLPKSEKYPYIIHSPHSKYLLRNTVVSNGILSGKIDVTENSQYIGNKIHIYITSDSVMKINSGTIISIPLNDIVKVKTANIDALTSAMFIVLCSAAIFSIVGLVVLSSGFKIIEPL